MFVRLQHHPVILSLLLGIFVCSVAVADERDEKALHVEETSPAYRFDKGNKWAILIGVNNYLDPKINSLKYCVADVRLMEKVLVEKCGYEKDHILVIADDQQQDHLRPLLINLEFQIRNWLSLAKEGDTVLVFFSGHGFLDEQLQGYLAPKDCRRNNLALGAFRTDDLRNKLIVCKASQKLLILDCCHAGAKGIGNENPSSEEVAAGFAKAEGLITLASSRKKQESQEWDKKKQGLFTYFLAEGLGGKADKDKNGIVDSDEIYNYLFQKVPLTAQRELNKKQTPVRLIGEDVVGLFGLSRVSISLRPEMIPDANDALLRFTIKNSSSKQENKPVVADAIVELMYRSSPNAKPQVLVKGTTNAQGKVALKTELSAVQQTRGEFLALVSRGNQSQLWSLSEFSKQGQWDLTILVPPVSKEDPDFIQGLKYYMGDGVQIDYKKSLALFHKAAERDHTLAKSFIGRKYLKGTGVTENESEATRWYESAMPELLELAEKGNPIAQFQYGTMCDEGLSVEKDKSTAVLWYVEAAEQDFAMAQHSLGWMYYHGNGVKQDYIEATSWIRKAAEQNYSTAQVFLGAMYLLGRGVEKDYSLAAIWYRKAAEQNDRVAQNLLGGLYDAGDGVSQSSTEAVKWFRKAAMQNYAGAQHALAWAYNNGNGVRKDYSEAIKWYRKAAAQNHAMAQNNLGWMYHNGHGVSRNTSEAIRWYRLAIKGSDEDASRRARISLRSLGVSP